MSRDFPRTITNAVTICNQAGCNTDLSKSRRQDRRRHMDEMHGDPWLCRSCFRYMKRKDRIKVHMEKHHGLSLKFALENGWVVRWPAAAVAAFTTAQAFSQMINGGNDSSNNTNNNNNAPQYHPIYAQAQFPNEDTSDAVGGQYINQAEQVYDSVAIDTEVSFRDFPSHTSVESASEDVGVVSFVELLRRDVDDGDAFDGREDWFVSFEEA